MKKLTATAILAVATLAGPAAVGQSQGLPVTSASHPTTLASDLVQLATRPLLISSRSIREFERSDVASDSSTSPRPVASWIMALAFLGFVVLRRTRSFPD